ncbi:hypothetical protein [Paenibacillus sp. DR312]|uniref:hypothetical protein n=1 Tax=Paenibacillus sp. DR312 TaxID=2871175 RepID=UPI001C97DFCD|nr:hypothetical protein [Paenibacillus sp. DR312]QZN77697.1 hypothetical protein K5K90_11185 [Paenibacillus sp. DR312]
MPILKDQNYPGNFIELSIVKHNPLPGEGSYFNYKYYINSELIREVKFGWTNMVLNSFLPMLKEFPEEKWKGYFSHFEENMEMKWMHEYKTDLYLIIFMDLGQLFTLKASKEAIREFGNQFEEELKSFLN